MNEHVRASQALPRFGHLFRALEARRGFFQDQRALQFAAVPLVSSRGDPEEVADALYQIAGAIDEAAGWFGALNSPVRFIIAAILYRDRIPVREFVQQVNRGNELFDRAGLKSGTVYTATAQLILRMLHPDDRIEAGRVGRLEEIHAMMSDYHWWLTGEDDYPACALLAYDDEPVESMGEQIEWVYGRLDELGYGTGNAQQLTSHILYLAPQPLREAVTRFTHLCRAFHEAGIDTSAGRYDDMAMLTFLPQPHDHIAEVVLAHRENLQGMQTPPSSQILFNIACGTAFLDLAMWADELSVPSDMLALRDMQSIFAREMAAAAAASAGAAAAAS